MHDVGDKIHIVALMFELAAPAVTRALFAGCCRHGKAAGLIKGKNLLAKRPALLNVQSRYAVVRHKP
jgi:hypothetical protein